MKITLTREKLIRGALEKKGATVEVSDGVAEWLIERGDAVKASTKPTTTEK